MRNQKSLLKYDFDIMVLTWDDIVHENSNKFISVWSRMLMVETKSMHHFVKDCPVVNTPNWECYNLQKY